MTTVCLRFFLNIPLFIQLFNFNIRGAFKTRASKVEKLFTSTQPEVKVTINAEKPRKGSFVVTVFRSGIDEEGTKIIELLDLPRPFKKLKDLDIDKVIADYLSDK